ncbi:MAG: NAD(+)/NADH kinase [Bacteroides sp.]|nr:NAD(+)/NADH kinase [Prevotella sp.]MCM1407105.1 NAD(+)/NADH kinase [Treponema brennaborense]MCM1470257.1 NAD(+)/NADH kinase [Bacteroides sp.]
MKKCVIVCNTFKKDAQCLAEEAGRFLHELRISSEILLYKGQTDIPDFSEFDAAATFGGDGTVLFAARACAPLGIPIFPVNCGEFGFIAGISKSAWRDSFAEFCGGTLPYADRSILQVRVIRQQSCFFSSLALNEAAVSVQNSARIGEFDVLCNGIPFGKYRADGVLAATATGSTAYSAAAGGPIVDPAVDAIVLNPVCPFSLSNRPLVLPPDSVLEISVLPARGTETSLACDGQAACALLPGDIIRIEKYPAPVKLAGCGRREFYAALRSKLRWSGASSADDDFDFHKGEAE